MKIPQVLRRRTQSRFDRLVMEHLSPAHPLAAGLRALPGEATAFASTQAAWRFYHNPRCDLRQLMRPLIEAGRQAVQHECDQYVLAVHDWSHVHLDHAGKQDRIPLGNSQDLGYGLQGCLLVSDRQGDPLAPVVLSLEAADGVHDSRTATVRPPESQLDQVEPVMTFVKWLRLEKPVVHVIDAEADSAYHYRRWSAEPGRYFLVRADDRLVQHEGQEQGLAQVHERLREQGAFSFTRDVAYHGQGARQFVAQTRVTLTRPAYQNRRGGPRRIVRGEPLELRLVISEVRDAQGHVLAVWYLLTNVPADIDAATIALWYYWRWRIESYFKLLKSAGQQLEHWQQESAEAFARRLVVASMACVLVWRLARSTAPQADALRRVLVHLSGRQMKRSTPFTEPALLAGLWVLLSMLALLEAHDPQDVRRWLQEALASPRDGPQCAITEL